MTLRAYLTILRPVRTFLFAAFYGWAMGFNLLKTFGGLSLQEAAFFTFAVIGPLIFGAFLIGPVHELMHRSFSALLPGYRVALRRRHLIALGIVSAACLVAARLLGVPFPLPATLGLILASISTPLLNRRRALGSGYFAGYVAYLAVVALIALPSRHLLLDAGRAFPWAFLVSGAAGAALCFRVGFSEEGVRVRSRSPHLVYCFQTSFPFLGSGGLSIARYAQAENGRLLAARKANKPGRKWPVASVGSSLREWVAVVHHSRFGGTGIGPAVFGLLIIGVSPLAMVLLIAFLSNRADPSHPFLVSEICRYLADAFRPGTAPNLISTPFFAFALLFGLVGTTSVALPVTIQPLRLPLSRRRLAHCVFLETSRLNGLIVAAFALELCLLAIGTTLVAGQPFDASVLARPVAATLLLVPASFLTQAFINRAARHPWLLFAGFALPVVLGPGVAGVLAARLGVQCARYSPGPLLDRVFTPSGFALCLAVIALAAALHWLALRRHYRTCDFSRPLPWAGRTA